jgi:hypothetical protein
LKSGRWHDVHTNLDGSLSPTPSARQPFCIFHGRSGKIHTLVTLNRDSRSRQGSSIGPRAPDQEQPAVSQYRSALAALLLIIPAAFVPAAAQQSLPAPQVLANETCAGCFAYLEFSSSLEPESYAMRGETTETSALLSAADEWSGRPTEQAPALVAASKQ